MLDASICHKGLYQCFIILESLKRAVLQFRDDEFGQIYLKGENRTALFFGITN